MSGVAQTVPAKVRTSRGVVVAAAAPARRTQAERSSDTRERILDAAVAQLGERGYAGLRTAEVAQAAGISKGALTHHFPAKDDLVLAVVEHVFQRASQRAAQRAHRPMNVDQALRALLADAQEFFFSELFLIALDLAIQGRLGDATNNSVAQVSSATRLPVEAHWRAALVDSGVPVAVADDLLWLSLSIVRGLAVRRLWQHDPPRFKRLLAVWRGMVVGYLAALPCGATSRSRSKLSRPHV